MAQRGFVLLSGILILGIFMFVSTIYTLENYHTTSQTQQTTHHSLQHPSAYSFLNPFSSSSNSTSSTPLKYFPIPFFQNESLWDLNHRFDHLFNQSSFPSIENYFSSKTDSSEPSNITSSSSFYHRPYLSFVQNQTKNLWNNVKNFKFYQYTNWNVTESSNSSSFESQLVNLFVSKSKLDDSRSNPHLRGEPEPEKKEEEEEEEDEEEKNVKRKEVSEPSVIGLFLFLY
jgi:hypothetical protein